MKVTVSPSVRVEITAADGRCFAADAHNEEAARVKLARQLHDMADRARREAHEYAQLANSLDA